MTATFECPAAHVGNCTIDPPPVASCNPGDLATGGAAYRIVTIPAGIPLQQFVAVPYPTVSDDPVTGFTTTPQGIGPGDTVYVVAICANLP